MNLCVLVTISKNEGIHVRRALHSTWVCYESSFYHSDLARHGVYPRAWSMVTTFQYNKSLPVAAPVSGYTQVYSAALLRNFDKTSDEMLPSASVFQTKNVDVYCGG